MSSDANDRTRDQRVSETYRRLATERTPPRLDRAVLRMARKEGRTPYAAARAWMRPFAWAATIALCLAIVLQLTELPPDTIRFGAPVPAEPAPAADAPRTTERAEPTAADEPAPRTELPVAAPGKRQAGDDWRAGDAPALAGKTATFSQESARADRRIAPPPETRATEPVNADREAAAAADRSRRQHALVDAAPQSAVLESRSLAAGTASGSGSLCPAEVRDSAALWHDCIESLRGSVPEDRLAQEIAEFDAAYPDFVAESRAR